MNKNSDKGLNPLITSIFLLAVVITGIILVIEIGTPAIERSRDNSIYVESRNDMVSMINIIEDIALHGSEGTSRDYSLSVTDGEFVIDSNENSIVYTYDTSEEILSPALCDLDSVPELRTYGSWRLLDYRFSHAEDEIIDCSLNRNHGILGDNNFETVVTEYGEAINLTENYINTTNSAIPVNDDFTLTMMFNGSGTLIEQGNFSISTDDIDEIEEDNEYHLAIVNDDGMDVYVNGSSVDADIDIEEPDDEDTSIGDGFDGLVGRVRVFDIPLYEEEIELLEIGGLVGSVEGFELFYEHDRINITNSHSFGSGSHNLYFRHQGYDEDKVNLEINRV